MSWWYGSAYTKLNISLVSKGRPSTSPQYILHSGTWIVVLVFLGLSRDTVHVKWTTRSDHSMPSGFDLHLITYFTLRQLAHQYTQCSGHLSPQSSFFFFLTLIKRQESASACKIKVDEKWKHPDIAAPELKIERTLSPDYSAVRVFSLLSHNRRTEKEREKGQKEKRKKG